MEENNLNNLKLQNWQYTIRHTDVNNFIRGEKVFLKSNPECPMTVHKVNLKSVTTKWYAANNEIQICEFPPECILQYKYAGMITYRKNIHINLN